MDSKEFFKIIKNLKNLDEDIRIIFNKKGMSALIDSTIGQGNILLVNGKSPNIKYDHDVN